MTKKPSREKTVADLGPAFVRKRPNEILAEIDATLEATMSACDVARDLHVTPHRGCILR